MYGPRLTYTLCIIDHYANVTVSSVELVYLLTTNFMLNIQWCSLLYYLCAMFHFIYLCPFLFYILVMILTLHFLVSFGLLFYKLVNLMEYCVIF